MRSPIDTDGQRAHSHGHDSPQLIPLEGSRRSFYEIMKTDGDGFSETENFALVVLRQMVLGFIVSCSAQCAMQIEVCGLISNMACVIRVG